MKTTRYIMVGIALMACAASLSKAQNIVRVHVTPETTLEQALGEEWASVDSLVITGQASGDDLKMLRRCIYDGATTGVDMSGCTVPGNTLPDAAFMAEFRADETGAVQPSQQLRYFTLPSGLRAINEFAFAHTGLRAIDFPASLTSVGQQAFYGCKALRGDVCLPAAVGEVGRQAFAQSWHITGAWLPPAAHIGQYAFMTIPLLQSVDIPAGCQIDTGCFLYDQSLSDVTMADDVQLGYYAFEQCRSLESVKLPRMLPRVGYALFMGSGLQSVQWPEVAEMSRDNGGYVVMEHAFESCRFQHIEIPEGVTHLGQYALANNELLESVILPDNMMKVSNNSFQGCPRLTAIYSKASLPAMMEAGVEPELCSRATLYVPKGSKQTYEASTGWREFEHIVEVEEFPYSTVDNITAPVSDRDLYYDLRGIKVDNPSQGLYIHRGKVVALP